ncbi:MAG: DUF692 domain-containing protein [Myxococcales bacterium]|nr:DUF692 domain-containing protein [Myxococcales bacterium]
MTVPAARHVGIGWRPELAADLLRRPPAGPEFIEVVAENCFVSPAAWREAAALRALWPVVPHGVKLSLGSAEGIDRAHASRLGRLARELRAPLISEHVAYVRSGGVEVGHLTPVPRSREAVRVIARNVARARRELPDVPLLLENIACTLQWPARPGDLADEGLFHHDVARATGCGLLLDLGNLLANARNAGVDPLAALDAFPLGDVAMIHVAGGRDIDGYWFDTHADPLGEPIYRMLAAVFTRVGPRPTLLERDAEFPPIAALLAELDRCRQVARAAEAREAPAPSPTDITPVDADELAARTRLAGPRTDEFAALASAQTRLAALLTDHGPAPAAGITAADLTRTRAVLQRKRVDEALPLLPRTARHGSAAALAERALAGRPRAASLPGIADAWTIAAAARDEPALADGASVDHLVLRARFVGPDAAGGFHPRSAPYVGHTTLSRGGTVWIFKGPGAGAGVHLREPRGHR